MFRTPNQTPDLSTLLDGLPTRDPKRIARHLGISARTLARWRATGQAPRLAYLALFWETHWGLSLAHCDAVRGEQVALGLARCLEEECERLRSRVQLLEELGDFGAANLPFFDERPRGGPALVPARQQERMPTRPAADRAHAPAVVTAATAS